MIETALIERLFAQVTLTNATMTLLLITILVAVWWLLLKVMREDNGIEWWQYISTTKPSGEHVADLDKLLKLIGGIIGSWAVVKASYATPPDLMGLAAVLAAYFAFVGGAAGYAAKLRSDAAKNE